ARLGVVDLNGDAIERETRAMRFTRGQRREGLLAGVRADGRPVITSSQGGVYVFQIGGKATYSIKDNRSLSTNPHRGSISVNTVDNAVSQRLEEKLHTLVFHASIEKELGGNPQCGAQAVLDHIASLRRKVSTNMGKLDETIVSIEKNIALEESDYAVARDVMYDIDKRKDFEALRKLR